jgi:CDP-diacylglycerol--serine O-phosphatidyltransferase
VAFGVAPAVLAYLWALEPFGRLGWLAAFMYVICGALRLARFNVQKDRVDAKFFNGLPIPAAACFIASLILFTSAVGGITESKPIIIIFMIYLLSFLMVSTVNYLSFKEVNIRHRKPFNVLVSIILIFTVIAYKPQVMLFIIMLSYILSGPAVTFYRLHGKRSRAKSAASSAGEESRGHKALDQGRTEEVDTS